MIDEDFEWSDYGRWLSGPKLFFAWVFTGFACLAFDSDDRLAADRIGALLASNQEGARVQ